MNLDFQKFTGLFLLAAFIFPTISAQTSKKFDEKCACSRTDKIAVKEYVVETEAREKLIVECKKTLAEGLRIAGNCEWGGGGCPTNLVKPIFSVTAQKLKLHGFVKVEVIIDETGKVLYTKVLQGNGFFRYNARRAACKSRFRPLQVCGKVVKFKRIITYNFMKP